MSTQLITSDAALAAHKTSCPDIGFGRGGAGGSDPDGSALPGRGAPNVVHEAASRSGVSSQAEMRAKILAIEAEMKAMTKHQIEIKTTHHFAPGVYMREIFIPKGTTLTGHIHKTEHLNILSQGVLQVWTEDGMKTLTASTVVKSQPGIKRVGHALEDSVWITVHPNVTNEQDVDALFESLVVESFEEFLAFTEQKQIKEDQPCLSSP